VGAIFGTDIRERTWEPSAASKADRLQRNTPVNPYSIRFSLSFQCVISPPL